MRSGRPGRAEIAVAALAIALCVPSILRPLFCLDDAYIHLAYVKSLRLGDGLSYNPGDFETGISSPLWLLVLSILPISVSTSSAATASSVLIIKLLGTALHAASALLAMGLLRTGELRTRELHKSFAPLAAGLMTASLPIAVQGATSGMEVPLAAALALLVAWLALRERYALAAVASFFAYLARPELLVYCTALGLLLAWQSRSPRALGLALGAGLGALAFGAYCWKVSGYFWPNTYYVKATGLALQSFGYLATEVLPQQPLVLSGTGVLLLGIGIVTLARGRPPPDGSVDPKLDPRSYALACVCAAALITILSIVLSRELFPRVQFYQSRYFAVVLWVLPVLAACGLAALATRVRAALLVMMLLPVLFSTSYLYVETVTIQREQERGIGVMHIAAARYLNEHAPGAQVLGAEGAGTLRYFTSRSLEVVDLMGLNDRHIAHLGDHFALTLCHLRERGVTHLMYPAQWQHSMALSFELHVLARFTDHAYAQIFPPEPWQVTLAEVRASKPAFTSFCDSPTHLRGPAP